MFYDCLVRKKIFGKQEKWGKGFEVKSVPVCACVSYIRLMNNLPADVSSICIAVIHLMLCDNFGLGASI
jgi:hypothetical protein